MNSWRSLLRAWLWEENEGQTLDRPPEHDSPPIQGLYTLGHSLGGIAGAIYPLDLILGDNAANKAYPMLHTFLLRACHAAR